jgi:hypothetical protein
MFGLGVEIIFAFLYPEGRSCIEIIGLVSANSVIALGVYGELHFGGRASMAQKKEIVEANERTEQLRSANLKLEAR